MAGGQAGMVLLCHACHRWIRNDPFPRSFSRRPQGSALMLQLSRGPSPPCLPLEAHREARGEAIDRTIAYLLAAPGLDRMAGLTEAL